MAYSEFSPVPEKLPRNFFKLLPLLYFNNLGRICCQGHAPSFSGLFHRSLLYLLGTFFVPGKQL